MPIRQDRAAIGLVVSALFQAIVLRIRTPKFHDQGRFRCSGDGMSTTRWRIGQVKADIQLADAVCLMMYKDIPFQCREERCETVLNISWEFGVY